MRFMKSTLSISSGTEYELMITVICAATAALNSKGALEVVFKVV